MLSFRSKSSFSGPLGAHTRGVRIIVLNHHGIPHCLQVKISLSCQIHTLCDYTDQDVVVLPYIYIISYIMYNISYMIYYYILAPARLHVQKSTPVAGILCKDYTLCILLLVQNPMNPTLEAYHHAVHYIQCTRTAP